MTGMKATEYDAPGADMISFPLTGLARPRRWRPVYALVVVLLLALAACGPGDDGAPAAGGEAPGEPRRGGTLVIGTISDIDGINELTVASTQTFDDVAFRMFLHLLAENPDFTEHPATFKPQLASSWEWSADHTELTFHLREDAVWSDGVPVTAEDVRFTWQAQIDPDVAWSGAYFKDPIEDVEVVDDKTVVFHFSHVSPYLLLQAVEGVILPKHVWGQVPFSDWRTRSDFFRENLVVNGPYRLERWVPQQEIVLVRNESYFDADLPYIDRLVYRFIPEKGNQVTQLLAGELGFIQQIPVPEVDRLRAAPGVRIDGYWHRLYSYVAWNMENPLFADREVRQALALAIDRQEIVDTLWGELGRVASSPIVANVWAHNDEVEPWPFDPERARRMLAEAGWEDHDDDGVIDKDGLPFAFEMMTNQGNRERNDAAVMIQQHLSRVGIDARPRVVEFNSMMSRLDARDFDASLAAWGMPTTLDLRYAFHSDSITDGENFSHYSNPRVDRLIEQMESLPELADAAPILDELQEILYRDQPMMFLWESQRINAIDRRLQNVQSNLLSSLYNLEEWWLAPAAGE